MKNKKEFYDIIFVVLTYGYTKDFIEFAKGLEKIKCRYKIIMVNNFYDESTKEKNKKLAMKYNCCFVESENKGYGFGNNIGIDYAKRKFEIDYLIVSNPDVIIEKFDLNFLKEKKFDIVGPKIITSTGKNQNPFYVKHKFFPVLENLCLRKKIKLGYYSVIIFTKISKLLNSLKIAITGKKYEKVYAVHGSFIIFSKKILDKYEKIFDENIFLFNEEVVLAIKMKNDSVDIFYVPKIKVYHKEDGCMKFLNGSMYDEEVKSNTYVLKNYIKKYRG